MPMTNITHNVCHCNRMWCERPRSGTNRTRQQLCSQYTHLSATQWLSYDDVMKRKHFLRYWPFVRGNHRSPVDSSHKGQWRGALMFSLICVCRNGWVNNREDGDFRRYRVHYDVTVMCVWKLSHGTDATIVTSACNYRLCRKPKWCDQCHGYISRMGNK